MKTSSSVVDSNGFKGQYCCCLTASSVYMVQARLTVLVSYTVFFLLLAV
jgi:hypothetical protein